MEESRIDRIERYLAEFIQGMKEERAAFAEERVAFAEERVAFAEERKAIAELRESQKKTDEQIRELRESQKKTDEQIEKTSKKVEEVSKKLGEMGIIDGKVGEDLFYRNVRYAFGQKDIAFSDVRRNVRKKGMPGEYDIVAVGENRILVVEVKKRIRAVQFSPIPL